MTQYMHRSKQDTELQGSNHLLVPTLQTSSVQHSVLHSWIGMTQHVGHRVQQPS